MEPNISFARAEDIPVLTILINKAYKGENNNNAWTSEGHLIDGSRTNEPALMQLLSREESVILKYTDENGSVCGSVYLEKQLPSQLYIGLLSVMPDKQATGIGKKLLAAAEQHARMQHCNKMVMTVISIREELVAWYKRRGYQLTGELKPFPGEHTTISNKKLELFVLEKSIQ